MTIACVFEFISFLWAGATMHTADIKSKEGSSFLWMSLIPMLILYVYGIFVHSSYFSRSFKYHRNSIFYRFIWNNAFLEVGSAWSPLF